MDPANLPVPESAPQVASETTWLHAGTVADIRARGVVVVTHGASHPLAVFAADGCFHAVDNRCPHLGFPLSKGTVQDGILTCHWHHANFDLRSGCAFDTWADDIPAHAVRVEGDAVLVAAAPLRAQDAFYHSERLRRGLDQDLGLLQTKSLIGLLGLGVAPAAIVRDAVLARLDHLRDLGGLVDVVIVGGVHDLVGAQTGYLMLARGLRQVAASSQGNRRPPATAFDGERYAPAELTRWFRRFVGDRQRDGAERVLLTAIRQGCTPAELVALVVGTASQRVYADQGHVVDFANKACELLDQLGWDHAERILPLVIPSLVAARGAEEGGSWHHPVELIAPLRAAEAELAGLPAGTAPVAEQEGLLATVLGDDPLAIIATLTAALRAGTAPVALAQLVCHAAALRLARFAASNEVGDWFAPRHTYSFANAVHQAVTCSTDPAVVRALLHAALAVYQDRFLNVPPARLPRDDPQRELLPTAAAELLAQLLQSMDGRSPADHAGLLVSRYLQQGHPLPALHDTLALATVREDVDFHPLQTLDAGLRQSRAWVGRPEAELHLVAIARSLAAVCPTPRARHKTALTAQRLQRGERIHEG